MSLSGWDFVVRADDDEPAVDEDAEYVMVTEQPLPNHFRWLGLVFQLMVWRRRCRRARAISDRDNVRDIPGKWRYRFRQPDQMN